MIVWYLSTLFPLHAEVKEDAHGEEVQEFQDADGAETKAESEQTTDVGEEINESIELPALIADEVQVLEIDVHHRQVVLYVSLICQMRMLG